MLVTAFEKSLQTLLISIISIDIIEVCNIFSKPVFNFFIEKKNCKKIVEGSNQLILS